MPDGTTNQSTALAARQEFDLQLEQQMRNFKIMLPAHVPVEKFKRVVVMAVMQNQDLFYADRRSFFLNAQKCAADGLLPDGREAVLLPFNTRVKRKLPDGTQQEVHVDLVQYIPMIQGIRKRMRNTGQVTSAEAQLVYQNDKFFQKFGSEPQIVHEPPSLGTNRGNPVGAYAIIRLKSGEIIQEVMDFNEIERIRSFSKAKDGPAWRNHWGEMARKTVLKRGAKSAPVSAELDELLARDDDDPDDDNYVDLPAMEPEPHRQIGNGNGSPQPGYLLVDADGEQHEYETPAAVEKALTVIFRDARDRGKGNTEEDRRRGREALDAAAENNANTIGSLRERGHVDLASRLETQWLQLKDELNPFGLKPTPTEPPRGNEPAERSGAADAPVQQPRRDEPLKNFGKLAAALTPPVKRGDLLAGEEAEDWPRYAEAMIEMIRRATAADLAAVKFSELPHMKKMKRGGMEGGDQFRRVMDAVAARVAALREEAA